MVEQDSYGHEYAPRHFFCTSKPLGHAQRPPIEFLYPQLAASKPLPCPLGTNTIHLCFGTGLWYTTSCLLTQIYVVPTQKSISKHIKPHKN